MIPDLSKIFHASSKDHSKGHAPISLDPSDWPDEWKVTHYKTYSRSEKIAFESATPQPHNLFDAIRQRHSVHAFNAQPISLSELGLLMQYSCGITRRGERMHHRAQPSGGGRYPIEVYALVFTDGDGLPSGIYHYNVKEHALDVLSQKESFTPESIQALFSYPWVQDASVVIVMTGVFARNQIKYGERGYRYLLIEAGHIGQNVQLVSQAIGVKSCPMAASRDEAIEKLLDIDGVTESLLYTVALGK
jgi:SagB-type dehydrogenase family enzyme